MAVKRVEVLELCFVDGGLEGGEAAGFDCSVAAGEALDGEEEEFFCAGYGFATDDETVSHFAQDDGQKKYALLLLESLRK